MIPQPCTSTFHSSSSTIWFWLRLLTLSFHEGNNHSHKTRGQIVPPASLPPHLTSGIWKLMAMTHCSGRWWIRAKTASTCSNCSMWSHGILLSLRGELAYTLAPPTEVVRRGAIANLGEKRGWSSLPVRSVRREEYMSFVSEIDPPESACFQCFLFRSVSLLTVPRFSWLHEFRLFF